MGIPARLFNYLRDNEVDYEEVRHPREVSACRIAERAHVPGDRLAKAVLIKSDGGYRVAIIPGTCRVDLASLSHMLDERLGLATEDEIERCFKDCDAGAVMPLGGAYQMDVCYDDALMAQPDIYLEAGDHKTLVHMSSTDFARLMGNARHGSIARHM